MIRRVARALLVWMVNAVAAHLPDDPVSCRLRAQLYRPLRFRSGPAPTIRGGCRINGFGLRIGARVFINRGCHFDLTAPILLGEDVVVGHHAIFATAAHDIGPARRRAGRVTPKPIVIGDGAWIGARSIIMPGVRIGRGAVIGAGSIVTRDVPDHQVAAGNPARSIRVLPSTDNVVPVAGIEPATFGLQNRCSTS